MTSIHAFVLAAMIATIAGCVVPVEPVPGVDAADLSTQSIGDGVCAPNQSTCFVWSGSTQVSGTCTSTGSCCTGCIDINGACQTGNTVNVCGAGGGRCANCNDNNVCTTDACNPSGYVCYHGNKTNDTTCGRGGHCDPANGTCCAGVFVVASTTTYTCETTCPACMCPQPAGAVCVAAPGAPSDCTCP